MTAAVAMPRPKPIAASAVAACSVALTTLGAVLGFARPTTENLIEGHLLGDAAVAIVSALVGGLLLTRLPRHPVGRLFAAVGLADGLALLAGGLQAARPDSVLAL